jgi:hypothetical protein
MTVEFIPCCLGWTLLPLNYTSNRTSTFIANDTCPLTCTGSDLSSIQDYYNNKFFGTFTMEPTQVVKVSPTECDVAYNYSSPDTTGTDRRRFLFENAFSCISRVVINDYGHLSGMSFSRPYISRER